MKSKIINEMKISFPALSENERFARIAAAGFLSGLDPLVDELSDIKTAVSEGVTNAIVHGYADSMGLVHMHIRILEGKKVIIKIRDNGCGIADIEKAREPMFTTSPDEERAGLGFAVMESFMDKVTVRSKVGKGTVLTLEKTVKSRKF